MVLICLGSSLLAPAAPSIQEKMLNKQRRKRGEGPFLVPWEWLGWPSAMAMTKIAQQACRGEYWESECWIAPWGHTWPRPCISLGASYGGISQGFSWLCSLIARNWWKVGILETSKCRCSAPFLSGPPSVNGTCLSELLWWLNACKAFSIILGTGLPFSNVRCCFYPWSLSWWCRATARAEGDHKGWRNQELLRHSCWFASLYLQRGVRM